MIEMAKFLTNVLVFVAAMLVAPGVAFVVIDPTAASAQPTAQTQVVDDPSTYINEAAALDPSRVSEVAPTTNKIDPQTLAQTYAGQHGLTGCVKPEQGGLDDVYLTIKVDPFTGQADGSVITEVGFDDALNSAGKRIVLLSCSK